MKQKGFTLIELLAVIVILGVILVIAIPSISAAILNSRKNSYVATANEFVDGARLITLNDPSKLPSTETSIIPITDIKLEKGSSTKSPFGKTYTPDSAVYITYDATNQDYVYSIYLMDDGGNGIGTKTGSGSSAVITPVDIKTVTKNLVAVGGGSTTPAPEPPYGNDANTLLLLHGEDLTDSSLTPKTMTNDNTTSSSTKSKFGTKSLYFNGNSSVYIAPGSSNFNSFAFGSGNFTIDFWMNADSFSAGTTLIDQWASGADNCSWLILCANGKITFYYKYQSNYVPLNSLSSTTTLSTSTWYHIAIVRNGTVLTIYLNGVADTSRNDISGSLYFSTNEELRIGRNGDTQNYSSHTFNGYMDEIRISNTARWTENFTPPIKAYN